MSVSQIAGVRLSGIACAVPEYRQTLLEDVKEFPKEEIKKIIKNTGVRHRHVAPDDMCVSDLCYVAAEKLIEAAVINKSEIDALIFISQGPDYIVPGTGCILQHRLDLKDDCIAFDVNLGCSAYPYGIWMAANCIHSGSAKKVLLLVGDLSNRKVSKLDRSTALLFGDAATATLIEAGSTDEEMTFCMGTDGAGYKNLIIPAGSFRNPCTEETKIPREMEGGNIRCDEDLYMNGAEIFTFTIKRVKPMIDRLLEKSGTEKENIDYFVLHQANTFIIHHLTKKLKVSPDKVPNSMENFGNTSSASIPMTMMANLSEQLKTERLRLVMAGFGVGYSWSAVELVADHLIMPDLVLV